jgi:phospholipid transport system substrate-binding protein
MRCSRSLALAVLLTLGLGLAPMAQAAEPTEQLRSQITQVYKILQTPSPSAAAQLEAAAILDGMFDWRQMSENALRRHWAQRTQEEQEQFTRLFADLFRRAYLSRIHVIDASKFQYLGDTVRGKEGVVKMRVFTTRGSGIDVDYNVYLDDRQRWRVRDVRVEQISLVDNYRTQFDSIITKSSFAELVKRLEALRNRSATPEAARSGESPR